MPGVPASASLRDITLISSASKDKLSGPASTAAGKDKDSSNKTGSDTPSTAVSGSALPRVDSAKSLTKAAGSDEKDKSHGPAAGVKPLPSPRSPGSPPTPTGSSAAVADKRASGNKYNHVKSRLYAHLETKPGALKKDGSASNLDSPAPASPSAAAAVNKRPVTARGGGGALKVNTNRPSTASGARTPRGTEKASSPKLVECVTPVCTVPFCNQLLCWGVELHSCQACFIGMCDLSISNATP